MIDHPVLTWVEDLLAAGGALMGPLLAVGGLLWYVLALWAWDLTGFAWTLRREGEADPAVLSRHGDMAATLVAVAPLLGLLGTVTGMITTFEALTTGTLFSESGGVARGIAEALTTTQTGLIIALPGLLVAGLLQQRAQSLERRWRISKGGAP